MRILFFDIGETDYKGIELLSAVLKDKGHVVDLILDPGLGKHYYLKLPFLNRLISTNTMLDKAERFKPDLIGMSIVTNNFAYFREFGQLLKQRMNVPIIVGGIHPTSVPEVVIQEDWVDMICIGDGEEAMLELAEHFHDTTRIKSIRNLWIKASHGSIIKNPLRPLVADIDRYPAPDRSIYAQYGVIGKRVRFMSGRGCPYACSFCVNSFRKELYPGEHYLRKRSVEAVISELEEIVKTCHPKAIRFEDDVFVLKQDWLREFKTVYKERIGLPFHCYITPQGVNEETLKMLREAGCESIAMGIQSGNEEIRSRLMNRHYSNAKVIEAARMIRDAGIRLYAEYMFGFPGEGKKEMWETMELSLEVGAYNSWAAVFFPYPGTELTAICRSEGLIDDDVYQRVLIGQGSPHSASILKHPEGKEIFKFKAMLPVYNAVPRFMRAFARFIIRRRYSFLHKLIYVMSIPLLEKKEFFIRARQLPVILRKTRRALHS
jgi:radical SAM superfamily enzyme YgiQ (UPF0313 family)